MISDHMMQYLTKAHMTRHYWFNNPRIERNRRIRYTAADMILNGGRSHHSALGHTMTTLLGYLENAGVPYTILALPGAGYEISVQPKEQRVDIRAS